MIDSRIETFLTLCKVMNYRKTAEILNMTQPAVTQHIHYLEEFYGCRLFIYDRKSLQMTAEAELLRKYAENVTYQEKQLIARLNDNSVRSISIGATKTIGEYVIAEHIQSYLKAPENRISVYVDNTDNLLKALSEGAIDLALVEGAFDRKKYVSRLYRREPFVGICGRSHGFAGREVSAEELFSENLILREEGSGTRKILEQLLAAQNHSLAEFKRITTISNFGLITRLAEMGQGVTFAYSAVMEHNDKLAMFRVSSREIIREFNYVFLDNPFSKQAVDLFDSFRADQ